MRMCGAERCPETHRERPSKHGAPRFFTLHRAPVGQGPSGPGWLATALGFWSGRALATGTAWAGLCLIQNHREAPRSLPSVARSCARCSGASCDENGRRGQGPYSPSALSRVALARLRVRRAASRAIGQLVAASRLRSSRPSLLGAPAAASARYPAHQPARRDDETSKCCVLNAKWLAGVVYIPGIHNGFAFASAKC